MVKGPQSAYLILKLFFKTRERRSVSILLYKTREHVIRCEMEMHIKLNLPWGANKDEALPQVFPSDNKKHVRELASQSAKCPLVAKARPRHFTGDSNNWELGGEDRGRSVHLTSPQCTLISSLKVPSQWRREPAASGQLPPPCGLRIRLCFGLYVTRGPHIKAPTCLSGCSFHTIGHEMQYGPGGLSVSPHKAKERMGCEINELSIWRLPYCCAVKKKINKINHAKKVLKVS